MQRLDRHLDQIKAHADQARAAQMAAYHKAKRPYLGVPNPVLNDLTKSWRRGLSVDEKTALADALWQTNIHEARVAAAKLLSQARIRPDDGVWSLVHGWPADFDGWAIADHACSAIQKRLTADPARLDAVEVWTHSDHMWTRRAALVATMAWTKQNNPKPEDLDIRDRILGWAASYVSDRNWFMQKSIGWWLRELSKHDAPRVVAFLDTHGSGMKAFARKEAVKYLPDQLE